MEVNEMINWAEYSKDSFKRDVEEWSSKDLKFILTEDWGRYSSWATIIKGSSCNITDDMIFIIDNEFHLDLYDEDYKVYVDEEDIYNDETKVFKYPMYRIYLKDKNKPYITIEIL